MDIVISKSDRKDKKLKAVIDGKKLCISVHLVILITLYIKMMTEKINIFSVIKRTRTGMTLKQQVFMPSIFYGINQLYKNL